MNLQRLKYFAAVVREGGLRAAADMLDISQPALTRHIQALERELGVALFDRVRGRIKLAESGRLLFARLPVLEAELEFLQNGLRAGRPDPGRRLRVGALQSLLEYVLPQAILGLRRRDPAIGLTVFGFSTEQILARVITGEYDMGIVAGGFVADRRITAIPLFREPFAALVAAGHPVASVPQLDTSALFDEELVTFSTGFRIRQMLEEAARRAGQSLRVAAEIEAVSGIKSLALANLGIAPLPISALASEAFDTRCRVIPVNSADLVRTVHITYRADVPPPDAIFRLTEEIQSIVASRLDSAVLLPMVDAVLAGPSKKEKRGPTRIG